MPVHSPFRPGRPSLFPLVELLRARPTAVFWSAALSQALLWFLVPSVFYASPPGDMPEVLAVGREWQLGSWLGPPLAFWLAEIAFNAGGGHAFGVYALSQACVIGTLWALFTFGKSVVGETCAALATLLMTGVFALSIPTPEFGPNVLAMPFAALALLFYWRAVGEGRRIYWVALAFDLGLLLFASYWGFLLLALLAGFTVSVSKGRAALGTIDPWAAGALALLVPLPHWAWLYRGGIAQLPLFEPAPVLAPILLAVIIMSHAGLFLLAAAASGVWSGRSREAVEMVPAGVMPFARTFVFFFAIAPAVAGTLAVALFGRLSATLAGQLVLMSGIAVIVGAGNPIRVQHPQVVAPVWTAVLILPALAILIGIVLLPWTGVLAAPGQEPAGTMGRFFSDTFQRRVGKPLELVAGDLHTASLIALASPSRPSVFAAAASQRTPWVSENDARIRGAIIVWPITDVTGTPPPTIRARFPDLVAEVPQTFERPVQGLLPSVRIGWALIRPQPLAR